MFKKNKQLIIGFLLGALIFGVVPVGATVQDYLLKKSSAKLMVDGKEFANKDLPVLNYQGYNYIPAATFREICNRIGVGFEWVGEKNEIQISTIKNSIERESGTESKNDSTINMQKDGLQLMVVDEVEYLTIYDVMNFVRDTNRDYIIEWWTETNSFRLVEMKASGGKEYKVLIKDIPVSIFHNKNRTAYVEYNYFKHNILPLIK